MARILKGQNAIADLGYECPGCKSRPSGLADLVVYAGRKRGWLCRRCYAAPAEPAEGRAKRRAAKGGGE